MSKYFIPVLFLIIFVFAIIKKVKPYDAFTLGAKPAIPFAVSVFPYLVSIFVLTELFEVSGISNTVANFLSPLFKLVGIPKELTKLVLPSLFRVAVRLPCCRKSLPSTALIVIFQDARR